MRGQRGGQSDVQETTETATETDNTHLASPQNSQILPQAFQRPPCCSCYRLLAPILRARDCVMVGAWARGPLPELPGKIRNSKICSVSGESCMQYFSASSWVVLSQPLPTLVPLFDNRYFDSARKTGGRSLDRDSRHVGVVRGSRGGGVGLAAGPGERQLDFFQ